MRSRKGTTHAEDADEDYPIRRRGRVRIRRNAVNYLGTALQAVASFANGYQLMRRNSIRRLEPRRFISASVGGLFALLACSVSAQNPSPTPGIPTEAEAERVVVTGSNIPTAEETGPDPVDTYRPEDIVKLGARNPTDLLTKLPQEMGSTINQNANGVGGGDGSVIPNLRGLLPKETLVLIDGKRA